MENSQPKSNNSRPLPRSHYSCCSPVCQYVSWAPDAEYSCKCRGVKGAGMKFPELTYHDSSPPFGEAKMKGGIFWYTEDTKVPDNKTRKYFLGYAEFIRKNDEVQ